VRQHPAPGVLAGLCTALLAGLLAGLLGLGVLAPAPAQAAPVIVPPTAGLNAVDGTTDTVEIQVPEGVTPTQLTGTLATTAPGGTVTVLVDGQPQLTRQGVGRWPVRLDVPAGAVGDDRVLPVQLRYSRQAPASDDASCRALDQAYDAVADPARQRVVGVGEAQHRVGAARSAVGS